MTSYYFAIFFNVTKSILHSGGGIYQEEVLTTGWELREPVSGQVEGPKRFVPCPEPQTAQIAHTGMYPDLCSQSGVMAEARLCQGLWKRLCCCNHAQTWRWHVHLPTFIPSMIITENRFMPSSRLCSFEFHSSFGTWETKAYRGQILNRVYGKQTPDRRMFLDLPNHGSNFSHWLGFENQRIICFKKLLQLSPWGRVCLWALRSWALTNTHTN